MNVVQLFVFACAVSLMVSACGQSSNPAGLTTRVGVEILHEDGHLSSGFHELWTSPRLAGSDEAAYRLGAELENEEFDPANLATDKDGRLWRLCHGADTFDYCWMDLAAYICRENCIYDLKVRTAGRLETLPKDVAPWDLEPPQNWASGSFDWAETAKRDQWDRVIGSTEDIGGTPTLQVQVAKGGLHVLMFPNRTF